MPKSNKNNSKKINQMVRNNIFHHHTASIPGEMTQKQIQDLSKNEMDSSIKLFRETRDRIIKRIKEIKLEGNLAQYMAEKALDYFHRDDKKALPAAWDDTIYSFDEIMKKQSEIYKNKMEALLDEKMDPKEVKLYVEKLYQLFKENYGKRISYRNHLLIDISDYVERDLTSCKISIEVKKRINVAASSRINFVIFYLSEEGNRQTEIKTTVYKGEDLGREEVLCFFYQKYNKYYKKSLEKLKLMSVADFIEETIKRNKVFFKTIHQEKLIFLAQQSDNKGACQRILDEYVGIFKGKLARLGKSLGKDDELSFREKIIELAKSSLKNKLVNCKKTKNVIQLQGEKFEEEDTSEIEIESEEEQSEVSSSESEASMEMPVNNPKNELDNILLRIKGLVQANQPTITNEPMEIDEEVCQVPLLRTKKSNRVILEDSESEDEPCKVPLLGDKHKFNRVIGEDETVEHSSKLETKDLVNTKKTSLEQPLSLQKKIQKNPKPVVFSKGLVEGHIDSKRPQKTALVPGMENNLLKKK